MAAHPEGAPCWADAMFSDVEGAKSFYGDVLGWTFGESSTEFGNYTQAYVDGKAVAAVVPPMPGQEGQSAWCLYFASPDVNATAAKIRDNGGEVLMEPMQVGEFGSMLLARSPDGVVFGVWPVPTRASRSSAYPARTSGPRSSPASPRSPTRSSPPSSPTGSGTWRTARWTSGSTTSANVPCWAG